MKLPKRLPTFEEFVLEGSDDYKNIDFYEDTSDPMFDYYYPDLEDLGIKLNKKQKEETYIATNNKRHLHIQLHPSLQKKGLAEKIIKAFIYLYGYRIIPKGRIVNPDIIKVLDKIKLDSRFEVSDEGDYYEIDEK